jgi:hypothetical protein
MIAAVVRRHFGLLVRHNRKGDQLALFFQVIRPSSGIIWDIIRNLEELQ